MIDQVTPSGPHLAREVALGHSPLCPRDLTSRTLQDLMWTLMAVDLRCHCPTIAATPSISECDVTCSWDHRSNLSGRKCSLLRLNFSFGCSDLLFEVPGQSRADATKQHFGHRQLSNPLHGFGDVAKHGNFAFETYFPISKFCLLRPLLKSNMFGFSRCGVLRKQGQ